jgi:4'-phosphopantetheinyl transferase
LEQLCDKVTAILPSLQSWSKSSRNQCIFDKIPEYSKKFDGMVFLADVGMYDASMQNDLDGAENERVLQFKSEHFKKRFIVSRFLLKRILSHIPGAGNQDALVLSRENKRIVVPGIRDIFLSLSYSGSCIALCVGKRKTGIDIEGVRHVDIRKIRSSPLFDHFRCSNKTKESLHALHVWTLVEAYAKLRDTNPYPLLDSSEFLRDASFVSYLADQHSIVSLACDAGSLKHTMLWINPETFSSGVKNTPFLSSLSHGDPNVRS